MKNLQREAELKLEAEQAERAAEDARLRELYPLPEDDQEFGEEYEGEDFSDNDKPEAVQDSDKSEKGEKTVIQQNPVMRICISCKKTHNRKIL